MKYDFTTVLNRAGHDAVAYDGLGLLSMTPPKPTREGFDAIPMWTADMNFHVFPGIQEAIAKRLQEPHFG